jgi:hypothetical protein
MVNYDDSILKSKSWFKSGYAEKDYGKVFVNMIHIPPTTVEDKFIDLWNHGKFSEVVNILPTANILKNGGSNYSDGTIIREAFLDANCAIRGELTFSSNLGNNIPIGNIQADAASGFVRLGHSGVRNFFDEFNYLGQAEKAEFKDLVQKLLGKITVNGVPLSCANNNLPWI